MEFWRSERYRKYFEFLDEKGGFYYEVRGRPARSFPFRLPTSPLRWYAVLVVQRWGDAPIHSLAVALLARKEEIHFFEEIGYRHTPFQHCPQGKLHRKGKCSCDGRKNFDYDG